MWPFFHENIENFFQPNIFLIQQPLWQYNCVISIFLKNVAKSFQKLANSIVEKCTFLQKKCKNNYQKNWKKSGKTIGKKLQKKLQKYCKRIAKELQKIAIKLQKNWE